MLDKECRACYGIDTNKRCYQHNEDYGACGHYVNAVWTEHYRKAENSAETQLREQMTLVDKVNNFKNLD